MNGRNVCFTQDGVSLYKGWIPSEKDIQMLVNYKNKDYDVIFYKYNGDICIHGKLSEDEENHIRMVLGRCLPNYLKFKELLG